MKRHEAAATLLFRLLSLYLLLTFLASEMPETKGEECLIGMKLQINGEDLLNNQTQTLCSVDMSCSSITASYDISQLDHTSTGFNAIFFCKIGQGAKTSSSMTENCFTLVSVAVCTPFTSMYDVW